MIDMMCKPLLMVVPLLSMICMLTGQYRLPEAVEEDERFPWPEGRQCAVSLSFDDARLSQIDSGIPLLDTYAIKATFYISPGTFQERLEGWKAAALNGHEIANHSMNHPCTGNYAFSRENALEDYTLEQMAKELDQASEFIRSVTDSTPRSFAYPCGQTFVGRGKQTRSYVPLVAERFITGRKWLNEDANDPFFCDMAQLLAMESDHKSFEQLLPLIEKAKTEGRWLILAGHEMADSGFQTTYLKTIEQFCQYANDEQNGLWVDTVSTIAVYILAHRENTAKPPTPENIKIR
jgi:peptidoglycan/xylan/chitin deacetylase (PgdA/CDA1 family)